jgi:hypothetical protein
MVQQLLKYIIMLCIIISISCTSIHTPSHTKYQRKNLKKFTMKSRYFIGNVGKYKRKTIPIWKQGYYWHPAVTNGARKRIRFAPWLKKEGEGELDLHH